MRATFPLTLFLAALAGVLGAQPTPTPAPASTPVPTASPTALPAPPKDALEDEAHAALVPQSTPEAPLPAGTAVPGADRLSAVPSPLGDKVAFRAVLSAPATVTVSVHDHFYAPVTVLQKAGSGSFDLLWKLRRVPDGIYYYEARIERGGEPPVKLPVQKVIVNR